MTARETIIRYHLIINKLRKSYSTFEQISDYLELESEIYGYDFNISKRTFKRDCEAIESIYGIEINFDFSQKLYKISEEEQDEAQLRMMEAFDVIDSFSLYKSFAKSVFFEERRPLGTENLYGLLHAINNQIVIEFNYYKYVQQKDTHRKAEPYALKEFKSRWYLFAKEIDSNKLKCFALDRLTKLSISNQIFDNSYKFSNNEYFKHSFGVMSFENKEPETVILSFQPFQGNYIKSMPLHKSQKILTDTDEEIRFSIVIHITEDFIFEILSHGNRVKVIEPKHLVDKIYKTLKEGAKQYEY